MGVEIAFGCAGLRSADDPRADFLRQWPTKNMLRHVVEEVGTVTA
jgi:hypothetical protein